MSLKKTGTGTEHRVITALLITLLVLTLSGCAKHNANASVTDTEKAETAAENTTAERKQFGTLPLSKAEPVSVTALEKPEDGATFYTFHQLEGDVAVYTATVKLVTGSDNHVSADDDELLKLIDDREALKCLSIRSGEALEAIGAFEANDFSKLMSQVEYVWGNPAYYEE
ncbi:MAG TPA: hypothetical protein DCL38_06255 [Lachnospiraceae bacterium]|nr:hypothetical protein [Lachnospiraceae bacterium]